MATDGPMVGKADQGGGCSDLLGPLQMIGMMMKIMMTMMLMMMMINIVK